MEQRVEHQEHAQEGHDEQIADGARGYLLGLELAAILNEIAIRQAGLDRFQTLLDFLDDIHQSPAGDVALQHDAPLDRLGDAARALPDQPFHRVRLPEVGGHRIKNHGLTAAQLVSKKARQPRVPALGHPADDAGGLRLFRIEVQIEVLGLEDLEFEGAVLDLVAAEVLRGRRGRATGFAGSVIIGVLIGLAPNLNYFAVAAASSDVVSASSILMFFCIALAR